jgi:Cof subfamily protein (haloacid dehalogenase superfamily)
MDGGYRLILLDIDGTLVGDAGVVTPRALDTLRRVRERGCVVVICTGRNRTAAERVARQAGVVDYVIALNGALALDGQTGETLYRAELPLSTARQAALVAHALGMTPVCFGVQEEDLPIYTDRRFPLFPDYEQRSRERLVYLDDLETDLDAPPLSMAVYGPRDDIKPLEHSWRRELGTGILAHHGPTAHFRCWYVQLTSSRADKALAAQMVAERLGVRREQALAVGDHSNDVELLRWAGLGICMGDGDPAALACADYITGTMEEEGAMQALERFVLRER